jgi:hypothetical protein
MSTHPQIRVNVITLALSALLGVGMLAGCTGGGSLQPATAPTGQATESAPTLVDAAVGAVLSAGSVHVNWVQTGPSYSLTESIDVTASGGRDVVTANETDYTTILFIDGVAYVEADQPGLEAVFHLPAYAAEEFWDEWIAVRSGEKLGSLSYDDLAEGMTLSSVANVVQICGACTLTAPTTVAGQRALSVQAPAQADDHLPASARFAVHDRQLAAEADAGRAAGRQQHHEPDLVQRVARDRAPERADGHDLRPAGHYRRERHLIARIG